MAVTRPLDDPVEATSRRSVYPTGLDGATNEPPPDNPNNVTNIRFTPDGHTDCNVWEVDAAPVRVAVTSTGLEVSTPV